MAPPSHRPLEGIRVLDLSRYLPGPFCTLHLTWLGATVTCVEQPPHGDPLRAMPPLDADGTSLAHRSLRRSAQVELLDLRDEAGRARAVELASGSDVLVESFRPGVAARLGLGHERLRASDPALVYCSISGYGQDGPWVDAPGHDIDYEAITGLLEQSGTRDELTLPAVPLADLAGGLTAATAICAALVRRAATGEGCHLDVSLAESALALQAMHLPGTAREGIGRSAGMLTGGSASYRTYRCSDGEWIAVGALEPKFFAALCARLGRPELAELHLRDGAQDELAEQLGARFATRPAGEWEAMLTGPDGGDCCVARVLAPGEVADHPQLRARGAVAWVDDARTTPMPAGPVVVDGTRAT